MAVTRPLKEGSVTTYQAKVGLGFPDILASEMDADLDTIYAAWNGGVGTANLVPGSVTYATLAPDAQLWKDTGATLIPGTSFATRIVAVPGDATLATVLLGNATAKGRVQAQSTGSTVGCIGLFSNRNWSNNAQDDAAKPSWGLQLPGGSDALLIQRSPAGSTTQANLLTLDATGVLTLPGDPALTVGSTILTGGGTAKGRVQTLSTGTNTGGVGIFSNRNWIGSNAQDDATKPSWGLQLSPLGDNCTLQRSPAGSTTQTTVFNVTSAGDLVISGNNATKATGTTWIAASDRRIKDKIEDYPTGLAAIVQLQPRTFLYNGKGGSTKGLRGYGFVADEIASIMPETVGARAGRLDPEDDDESEIQMLDQSNLILALVNAVKELAARVDAR